jgi:transposase
MPSDRRARCVTIPSDELSRLEGLAHSTTAGFALVQRARMLMRLASGEGPTAVARALGCSARNVRKWRQRFEASPRVESLYDALRSGRPPKFAVETRAAVIGLACERPDGVEAPFRDIWTQQALARVTQIRTGELLSRSTVQRILNADGLRPHRVKQWLRSQDPEFTRKVARVCELYRTRPPNSVVLSIDEKPMQALERRYPSVVGPGGIVRREYEYIRHGTAALLGAFDVHTGEMAGRVVPKRTAAALVAFLDELASKYPDKEIYVVWDNLNIHYDGNDERWTRFNERHGGRVTFVHTPLHASWVNQIEVWFSILQRRVLRYGSFENARQLAQVVEGFIRHWNFYERKPFRWRFSGRFAQTPERAAA